MKTFCIQRVRPALGTLVAVEAAAHNEELTVSAVHSAFQAIERVASLMHPTTGGSDVAKVCAAPLGTSVAIDEWTYAVLALAQALHGSTDGVFDPCTPERLGRMSDLDLSMCNAVTCRANVAIDLGGIAKGFAVDRAIDALHAHGCTAGLVNAGGDVRVFGKTPSIITVRSADDAVVDLELTNAALAVSGPRTAASPSEHRGFYLRSTADSTGASIDGHLVAVTAAEAFIADALTKCVMLCSREIGDEVLARYGARRVDAERLPYFQLSTR